MKKIFAGIVLPTLAALAVIGSGFSVYFFGENQDKISSNGSIKVDNLLRIGELTTSTTTADLHLDQTKAVRSKILESSLVSANTNGNFDGASNYDATNYGATNYGAGADAKGLYLTDSNTVSPVDKFEIKYAGNTAEQFVDYLNGACKVEIKTTFTFSGGAENYVGMDTTKGTDEGTWATGTNAGVYTYTWKTEDAANKNYTKSVAYNTSVGSTATFQFVYVAYNTQYNSVTKRDTNRGNYTDTVMNTAEPHTDAEYSAMLAAVKSGKLTIETVATIIAVTTTGA